MEIILALMITLAIEVNIYIFLDKKNIFLWLASTIMNIVLNVSMNSLIYLVTSEYGQIIYLICFEIGTFIVEALILFLIFKYKLWKCFLFAFIANAASLIIGLLVNRWVVQDMTKIILLRYTKANQLSFNELEFSAVDALVLCWFSFYDFDPILEKLPIEIKEVGKIAYYHKLDPYKAAFLAKQSRKMMNNMVASNRFKDARILAFKQVLDKRLDVQFGAIAVAINGKIVVSFRGTDPSLLL